jgi:excisionase family DNA binding protein
MPAPRDNHPAAAVSHAATGASAPDTAAPQDENPNPDRRCEMSQVTRQAWNPREVAAALGIGYQKALDLIHDGVIGHVRAGHFILVPDEELKRFLAPGIKRSA